MNTLEDKLKELKNEEIVWIIYIGIIILSFYSNNLERKYFLYNDALSKEKYRKTMIFIFSILVFVYLYFLKDSYDSVKKLDENMTDMQKNLIYLSFIASFLIALSGFILLYVAYNDKDIDVELAFN